MPDFSHETLHGRDDGLVICGVDEVGRGPLAGPVVAAAAWLPPDFPLFLLAEIRDSKKMSATARESLYEPLTRHCHYAIAEASVVEIEQLNILWASMLAMQRAVANLHDMLAVDLVTLHIALIDGDRSPQVVPDYVHASHTIIQGDDKSYSIAAASIIAKVHRDRLMKKLAKEFPVYGWETNVGYGTAHHLSALSQFGVTSWHRAGFAPVREAMKK